MDMVQFKNNRGIKEVKSMASQNQIDNLVDLLDAYFNKEFGGQHL